MNKIDSTQATHGPSDNFNAPQEASHSGFQNLPQQLSYPESDRRQAQRRQNDRSGKYDRRRNRCAHCKHFAAPSTDSTEVLGTCTAHHTPMSAMAFACPVFESNS